MRSGGRWVVVELEVPEGSSVEELLKGIRYRVLQADQANKRRKILDELIKLAESTELKNIKEEPSDIFIRERR
ncbi:MAG: hypothetical protein GXO00_01450 [Candidatus Diapherotrites archaeon]|nr:hypothetical protein [Candidatus Diapherotrites archaeon]